MISVLIIDDELLARNRVKECLQNWNQFEIVGECEDGFEAFKMIQTHKPKLIFLDIQMPRMTGFELLELLEDPPNVIFTTAYEQFALKAFENSATDYLLKPFGQERFDKALQKFIDAGNYVSNNMLIDQLHRQEENLQRVIVKHKGNIVIIPVDSVLFFEAYDDYVKIHTAENIYIKKQTLASFEIALPANNFVRVHRSYLINLSCITSIDNATAEQKNVRMTNGFHVPASRSGYQLLKEKLGI
jgi:two-component system LytT family response regulator